MRFWTISGSKWCFLVLVTVWLSLFAAGQVPTQKVLTEANMNRFPGFSLLEDYGSFRLYGVTGQALDALPQSARIRVRVLGEIDRLHLDRQPFDTQRDRLSIPGHLRATPTQDPSLMLVQFHGPIRQRWLDELEVKGASPVHYVRSNGYLVLADGSARQALRTLQSTRQHLQYLEPYHPFFKLGSGLLERVETPGDFPTRVKLTIQMVNHPGKANSESVIADLRLSDRVGWHRILKFQNTTGEFYTADIAKIASLVDVVWVGLYREPELLDEVQSQILAGALPANGTGPTSPGYLAFLDQLGFSQEAEDYPVLDITDDGIGNGQLLSGDQTLHQDGNSALASRVVYLKNCTTASDPGSTQGHGHINASIVAGFDTRSGYPFRDTAGYQRGLGVNPFQRVGGTRLFSPTLNLTYCGESYLGLIQEIVRQGAQISNHSWGCEGCAEQYDDISQAFDVGTRDGDQETGGDQSLLLVVAAGNNGPGPATIATPANAKNVLTVGASKSYRPNWLDGCNVGVDGADSAMDIIEFSSRGPAPGGRAKPELVAPGTHIHGTASPHPDYNGGGICDTYHPPGQAVFAASSGTSHSTPAVSAIASLAFYWLQHQSKAFLPGYQPSPAMLKAYLLAHATTYLTGESAGDTLPSPNQGYGMPDMSVAFDASSRYLLDQSVIFDHAGEFWAYSGVIPEQDKPVRIVLNYTDQAGALGTSPQVNDLDLEVKLNGTRYYGNRFNGRWSTTGGSPDAANNYEVVCLQPGSQGLLEIKVTAANISGDGIPSIGDVTDQDFALVAYNFEPVPDFNINVAPFYQSVCAGNGVEYTIDIGQTLGFSDSVELEAVNLPAGMVAAFDDNTITPPGDTVLGLTNTGAVAPGTYPFQVKATSTTGTKTFDLLLTIFGAAPAQTILQSPTQGAVDIPFIPVLRWFANPNAETYLLEVAEDAAFQQKIYTTQTSQNQLILPLALDILTTYHWRVTGSNACGTGQVSPVYAFTTLQPPPTLLVDDDDNNPDVRSAYTGALDQLGQDYDVWDVSAVGREPNALELTHFDQIIWFSGTAYGGRAGPDPDEGEKALKTWLDAGGCLFLTSQDYYFDFGLTDLAVDYLGVDEIINDATHQTVVGANDSPFYGLGPYTLNFPGTNFSDAVIPVEDAGEAWIGNDGTAGIHRKTPILETVYLAFPFEAIGPVADRRAVLEAFFNACSGACVGPVNLQNRMLEWPELEDIRDLIQCLNAFVDL